MQAVRTAGALCLVTSGHSVTPPNVNSCWVFCPSLLGGCEDLALSRHTQGSWVRLLSAGGGGRAGGFEKPHTVISCLSQAGDS